MTVAWWADALQWIIQSGFIPVLIAFFALLISAYSVYIARRTALLSAKPILMLVFDCHSEESKATVEIQNVGLGPAIIFDYQFLYHNKVIDTAENYKNLTSELMGVDKYGYIHKYCVSNFSNQTTKRVCNSYWPKSNF